MNASPARRRKERIYREYMDFFDKGEKYRRWNPTDDLPWDWLEDKEQAQQIKNEEGLAADSNVAICLETFCAVELFIPDYTMAGLNMSRDFFGHAWFHLAWGYEESKHSLTFRNYLLKSGLRTESEYLDFEDKVLEAKWTKPFATYRQMACYGALQESAGFLIYQAQKNKHTKESNPLLNRIFEVISKDEAAHTSLYRKFLEFEFEEDREGTEEDLAYVISHFEMPTVKLVPNYDERIQHEGVGISSAEFMERGIMPTLRRFGMNRRSLTKALYRIRQKEMQSQAFKQKQEEALDLAASSN